MRQYLQLDDAIIDVDVTPNRGDCLSINGVARETGVLTQTDVTAPAFCALKPTIDEQRAVILSAPEHCSRYAGRIIRNVDLSQTSPLWLREKLRRADVRSIDPVVDVTNYVMMELGQPMHAFDLDAIEGDIDVRLARSDERLVLLDDKDQALSDDLLVIADQQKPLAIAGIMGGKDSGVSNNTQHIFLESAFFAPEKMAGKANSFNTPNKDTTTHDD